MTLETTVRLRSEVVRDTQEPSDDSWFVNHYHCDACNVEWTDEWSSMCDDECGQCGQSLSPYESEDILVLCDDCGLECGVDCPAGDGPCLTSECDGGEHQECGDTAGNCCECPCHEAGDRTRIGNTPTCEDCG